MASSNWPTLYTDWLYDELPMADKYIHDNIEDGEHEDSR